MCSDDNEIILIKIYNLFLIRLNEISININIIKECDIYDMNLIRKMI